VPTRLSTCKAGGKRPQNADSNGPRFVGFLLGIALAECAKQSMGVFAMLDASSATTTLPAKLYVLDSDPSVESAAGAFTKEHRLALAHADSIEGFIGAYEPDRPVCLLVAINRPPAKDLAFLTALGCQCPAVAVVVLSEGANVPLAVHSFKSGAVDFLEKPLEEPALIAALSTAMKAAQQRFRKQRESEEFEKRLAELTERQREVFLHVVAGRPSKVIAYDLGISERTVEVHRGDVFRRMGVGSAVELAWLSGTFYSTLAGRAG
jgi:FixJ family two-component response regulator